MTIENFNDHFTGNRNEFTLLCRIGGKKIDPNDIVGLKQNQVSSGQDSPPIGEQSRIVANTDGTLKLFDDMSTKSNKNGAINFRTSYPSTSKAMLRTQGFETHAVPSDVDITVDASIDFSTHRTLARDAFTVYHPYNKQIYSYLQCKLMCTKNIPGVIQNVNVPMRILDNTVYTGGTTFTRNGDEAIHMTADVTWRYIDEYNGLFKLITEYRLFLI